MTLLPPVPGTVAGFVRYFQKKLETFRTVDEQTQRCYAWPQPPAPDARILLAVVALREKQPELA